MIWQWIRLIFSTLLGLGIVGVIIAQTRSIRCEKVEPTVVNCQIEDTLFWGAIRYIKLVNNVRRAFVDEKIGYSDASQYPIYRVSLVVNDSQEIPFTNWERNADYTNQVKNSLETFLQSPTETYEFNLNSSRNIWGAIVFIGLFTIRLLSLMVSPYQVRFILNKVGKEALLIRNFFPLGLRKETLVLDLVSLQFKEDTDSDNDTYYTVVLATPGIGNQAYPLKSSSTRQAVEDYWRFHPDIQLIKQFVRSEKLFPEKPNSGGK